MTEIDKRTHKLLREAINRAQKAFKGAEMNLTLRYGESLLRGGNIIGIKSKEALIIAMDTNHNGLFFDSKDRIIISAEGITATLDNKCKLIGLCKDAEVAEKIKRASKIMSTGQSGVPEAMVNDATLKELGKVLMQVIATIESQVKA